MIIKRLVKPSTRFLKIGPAKPERKECWKLVDTGKSLWKSRDGLAKQCPIFRNVRQTSRALRVKGLLLCRDHDLAALFTERDGPRLLPREMVSTAAY
jgi:hypothetical protein